MLATAAIAMGSALSFGLPGVGALVMAVLSHSGVSLASGVHFSPSPLRGRPGVQMHHLRK